MVLCCIVLLYSTLILGAAPVIPAKKDHGTIGTRLAVVYVFLRRCVNLIVYCVALDIIAVLPVPWRNCSTYCTVDVNLGHICLSINQVDLYRAKSLEYI